MSEASVCRQTHGYAILEQPAAPVASYDAQMRRHEAWPLLQRLCEAIKPLSRTAYRGVSRFPLAPLPSADPEILQAFEDTGCDVHTNYGARLRFMTILGDTIPEGDFDDRLLPDLEAAREVFSLLENPGAYEIVHLSRDPFCQVGTFLGFDIGYWGGSHYSIICDSAVRPLWHPPQPECFAELAEQLRSANEHFLFGSVQDAEGFRAYYRTQYWAETESQPGEFCIIRVSKPDP